MSAPLQGTIMTARVLLAEDNDSLSRIIRTLLESRNFRVHAAATGREALEALSSQEFDLLLLDLRLPELSGVDLLRRLRSSPRWQHLPVIVMSGVYKDEKFVAAARKLGVSHYLLKPFSREALMEAIAATLAGNTPAPPRRSLLELLGHIYVTGKSGLLTMGDASPIAFIRGEPCSFLARGREDFPRFLQTLGRISSEEVEWFRNSGEERIVLTQSGLLSYDELVEDSRLFLTGGLVDSLESKDGIGFVEGFHPPELPFVPVSVPQLLYEAAKQRPALFAPESFAQRYAGRFPARTPFFFRLANLAVMRKEDIDLLQLIDGRSTVSGILDGSPARNEAAAFLHYLVSLGMLTMTDEPGEEATADFYQKNLFNRPLEEADKDDGEVGFADLVEEVLESMEFVVESQGDGAPLSAEEIDFEGMVQRDYATVKDKNYYDVLGISPSTFSFNALKEGYFSRTRVYSPEKFMELSGSVQTMAEEVLAIYANAYNTLSNVVAKERYDELLNADKVVGLAGKQDDALQARIQFQSGKVFLEMGEYDNAEKALQDAYTLEPDNAAHCAFLAWTIYRKPANQNSRAAVERARILLGRSLQLDRNAAAYSFRGWMLLDEGRDGLAEGEFQKALKLNPGEALAVKGLRSIEEKRVATSKGLLRKLFR
jgi:CheY-like chemotaxis protein/tetratricopeptide (TPR) repeat protein